MDNPEFWHYTHRYLCGAAAILGRHAAEQPPSDRAFLKGMKAAALLAAQTVKRHKLAVGDEAGYNGERVNDE